MKIVASDIKDGDQTSACAETCLSSDRSDVIDLSISLERVKLVTSNLVRRLTARLVSQKMQK